MYAAFVRDVDVRLGLNVGSNCICEGAGQMLRRGWGRVVGESDISRFGQTFGQEARLLGEMARRVVETTSFSEA